MTKREALKIWRREILPGVRARFEQDGRPDYPARREAWNGWIDGLIQDRELPERAGDWAHPPGNTAPWESR